MSSIPSSWNEYENVTCRVASRSWALSVRPREEPMSGFPQFMARASWLVTRQSKWSPKYVSSAWPSVAPHSTFPDVRKRSSRNSAIATSLPLLLRLKLIHPNISFGSYLNGRFMPWRHKWDALLFTVRIHMIDHKTALSFNAIVSCECIRRHNWHSVAMWFVHCWDCLSGDCTVTLHRYSFFLLQSPRVRIIRWVFFLFSFCHFIPHDGWPAPFPFPRPSAAKKEKENRAIR